MKIALLEAYPEIVPEYLDYLRDSWHTLFWYNEVYDPTTIDAIVVRSKIAVDARLLEQYSSLRYVLRVWVGLEKIDTALLDQKWIQLINTPGSNSQAVAELVLRGMLSLLRNIQKKWNVLDDRFALIGAELHDKTIGIVGFGHIGRIVHRILSGFGGNTFLIYDPYISAASIIDPAIQIVQTKETLFSQSDIITFHIPLSPETRNFLSQKDFALLKDTVKIINTSRWGIIDENALIAFLSIHKNAWAYIDTREWEPENPKNELLALDNCIVTPHLGSMTYEANRAMHRFNLPQA